MNEAWWGLYVGLVLNLAVAAVLNNGPFTRPALAAWLVTLGAANELLGVLLVASPELMPRLEAVLRVGRTGLGRTGRWVRRLAERTFGRGAKVVLGSGVARGIAMIGGQGRVVSNPPPGATTEELVTWLVKQHERHDDRIHELERKASEFPALWRGDIAQARDELINDQRKLVRGVAEARIRLRLFGLLYVAIGLVLSWIGNLYSI
jgi:hypothetical protein